MKNLFLFLVIILLHTAGFAQKDFQNQNIFLHPESELTITGDTNISKFRCSFNSDLLERNVGISFIKNGSDIELKNAVLKLDNRGFDCGNNAINKDFHKLLDTEEYPEIILEVKKLSHVNTIFERAQVIITIAGKSKDYSVAVDNSQEPGDCFTGTLKLNINDFKLEPPKKAFGLIVIKEEITINFSLRFGNYERSVAGNKTI